MPCSSFVVSGDSATGLRAETGSGTWHPDVGIGPSPACAGAPAGETRYKAALSLGLTLAPVVTIPARQARAFRVIDNRTSEMTSWDHDLLPDALAGLDDLDDLDVSRSTTSCRQRQRPGRLTRYRYAFFDVRTQSCFSQWRHLGARAAPDSYAVTHLESIDRPSGILERVPEPDLDGDRLSLYGVHYAHYVAEDDRHQHVDAASRPAEVYQTTTFSGWQAAYALFQQGRRSPVRVVRS